MYNCGYSLAMRYFLYFAPTTPPVSEKPISGRPAFYQILLGFLILGGGALFLVLQVPTYLFPGPPATWTKLLAFAQSQAARV